MHDDRKQDVIVVADAAAQVSPYTCLIGSLVTLGLTVTERFQVFLPHTASIKKPRSAGR